MTTTDPAFRSRQWPPRVPLAPTPARVPALVEVVPTSTTNIPVVRETSRTDNAGGSTEDTAIGESSITLTATDTPTHPWGSSINVPLNALRDPGIARRVVRRFLTEIIVRALEVDMLVGDGSETAGVKRFTGILNTPGIGSVTRDDVGGETHLDAIARAVLAVQNADHYDARIVVVATPTDLQTLFDEKDSNSRHLPVRDVLYAVDEYVPSTALTAGTALVGAFSAGATLYIEGELDDVAWSLIMATDHVDHFTKKLATLVLENYVLFDIHSPGAFCELML